jgi:hypothetical protein
MVKNMKKISALFVLGILLVINGCNQANPPAYPNNGSALTLSFPVPPKPTPSASKRGVSAKDVGLSVGILRYRIASGTEVVTGAVNVNYGVAVGTISIPLPHNGTWLVSAEWFDNGSYPRFIGADQVDVAGATQFTLLMGDITLYGCSYASIADTSYCSPYQYDIFTFDTDTYGYSTNNDTGDIKVLYDAASSSSYIASGNGTPLKVAYLGTGFFVDSTVIPPGVTYYADTQQAKAAVLGSSNSAMAYGDVYAIELSPTYHVWVQIEGPYYCTGGYIYLHFRVNKQGASYMKYDATTYGATNCLNEYYYPGGGG